jgi:integrase
VPFGNSKRASKPFFDTSSKSATFLDAESDSDRLSDKIASVLGECSKSDEKSSGFATKKKKRHDRVWSIGLDRGFTKEELYKFLNAIEVPKYRLCFELMAYLGFRISEAIRVNLADLDLNPDRKLIRMWDCKSKKYISRAMPDDVYFIVRRYVNMYLEKIDAHDGFLIYATHSNSNRKHISDVHMRRVFRDAIRKAKLDDVYADIGTTGKQPGKRRKLYRLSTHSLRRFFIGRVYEVTRNPLLTQRAARHTSFSSTECYLDSVDRSVESGIQEAFSGLWRGEDKKTGAMDMGDFMKFYQLYQKMASGKL